LTDNDYRYLSSVAEEKNNIQVSRRALSEATLTYNGQDFEVSLFIVDPEYSYITGADIYKGAPFNRDSVKENSESVLINSTLEKQIFKIQEPINKELDIDGKSFAVRGVSRSPFQSLGSDLKVVYITQDSYRTHFSNSLRVSSIFVGTYDSSKVEQLKRELEVGLRQNRGLTTAEKSDFTIQTQEDLLKTTSQITDTITLFITVISSISLFVGGIGIMNIMLVSVKERVKEVGLRKAVGATNQDILVQFLTESVLFSIVGALIGTMLGNLIALTIQHIAHLPRYVSQGAVINSIIVATAVGLLFGLYPALNAAKLSPIEALRGE
jgi:putative ABC transport system permease protein